jgi:crotonobetainyl-CoA:carnitine CoA-transferase CaiB-like acyl-CoA transferase
VSAPRVLELGNYLVCAYAGMLLAEQGFSVDKWIAPAPAQDPILGLEQGEELWAWINHRKWLVERHARELPELGLGGWDIVLDNLRPSTLERWGIRPAELAERWGVVWCSLRSEVGERSFDIVAQARAWFEYTPWVPFYIGDTAPGALLAFKALAMHAQGKPGHYVLGQASCLQKLVEGELQVEAPFRDGSTRWDPPSTYFATRVSAHVVYRGEAIEEPLRGRLWKLQHLWHDGQGRIRL